MALNPGDLRARSEAGAWLGAFDVTLEPDDAGGWYSVDDLDETVPIGRDGAGGTFVLLPSGQVLYVASEGRAGIIAASFEALIQLVVACPYWLDILKFSGGGDIEQMRRAAQALEATLDAGHAIDAARMALRAELDLPGAADPVGALYAAVAASDVIVRALDGCPFTTLFNRFTIDNSPMLRNAAA